jgi:uncharacterized protein (TIGR03083 family)
MASTDIWSTIHGERKSLAADLQGLSDEQWATRSLCSDWTVRDVLAHMTATAHITPGSFFPKLVGSGFSFGRMQAKDIARMKGDSPAATLHAFEAVVTSTKRPPGPIDTMLGEVVVHSQDIRRALGIAHDYPTDEVVRVADFYKGSNLLIGSKKRIAGLKLRATDADWTTGEGAEVAGPVALLVMAMTGRKAVIDDLSGEGVATLASR